MISGISNDSCLTLRSNFFELHPINGKVSLASAVNHF